MKKSFPIIHTASAAAIRSDFGRCVECGEITPSDVAELRGSIAEAALDMAGVETLFALDRAGIARCPEWASFFVETVSDYIVWQVRPTGILDQEQAEWLVGQIDRAKTLTAFAILINVLAEADRVPAWLVAAARARATAWPEIAGAAATATRRAA